MTNAATNTVMEV